MKILILYGSTTGNTAYVAEIVASALESHCVDIKNVSLAEARDIKNYDFIIMGTSTWSDGEVQKDWKDFLPKLNKDVLKNKPVALFGLGDSVMFPEQFASGMYEIYERLTLCEATIIGRCDIEGYKFNNSKAVVNGKFCGLVIDQDNESNLTVERVSNWVKSILLELSQKK